MRTLIAAAIVAAASAACADTEITEAEADDIALSIGSSTATSVELGAMADAVQLAHGRAPRGVSFAGDGSWHHDVAGLAVAYDVTCRDAEEVAMPVCGAATHAASVTVQATGALDLPAIRSTTSRRADWTLTGLDEDGAAIFAGAGTLEYATTDTSAGVTTHTRLSCDATYEDLALAMDGAVGRLISGAIDYRVVSERTRAGAVRSFTTHARVTFTADGDATIEVADRHYHVDARTGLVARD